MFIREDETVEIHIYCRKNKNRYIALTEKDYKNIAEVDKAKYEMLVVKMRELTWGLFNQLQDAAMITGSDGEQRFNYRLYKENRLKQLIKEWSAKDKDGKSIMVSENMISHLSPAIAETILKAYDEITQVGEEEEGK